MPGQAITTGINRTGAHSSPETGRTVEASEQSSPLARPEEEAAFGQLRAEYALEAEPLGSVPAPGTLKGVVQSGLAKLVGKNPEVLIDKIGERLAHERSGVRLYQAFMVKCRVHPSGAASVPLDELEEMCAAEARHFKLLGDVLVSLGADPTAQSPCADACGIASTGVMQLLSDPRTSLAQALTGLLTVELADYAGWELLIRLAEQAGQDTAATQFAAALAEEQRHLELVRGWLQREVLGQADGAA
jgi:ferritin-like metal-binding protein YciE